jgi:hypothetical protein
MRLAEDKIKEAILHPDKLPRQAAVAYFSRSYSRDVTVLPLATQAIEKYGPEEAFRFVSVILNLAQTESTIGWVVDQLRRRDADRDYQAVLSRLLCEADPCLLEPREEEILQVPRFAHDLVPGFRERLRLLSWGGEQCWAELERIAEAGKDKMYAHEVGYDHARRVIEALARQGGPYTERVLALLREEVTEFESNPMKWMEGFVVVLAGEMRLEPAVPLVVKKLHEDGELLNEECMEALERIGTDGAVAALADGFPQAEEYYRLYGADTLGHIHTDLAVQKSLDFLAGETDPTVRANLGYALLCNFAFEGVEPVRKMVLKDDYDTMMIDLRGELVTACKVMGVRFPEFDAWDRETNEKEREIERRIRALETGPARPVPPRAPPVRLPPPPVKKKVSRNDPCPCGSGKKFKVCCLRKGQGG